MTRRAARRVRPAVHSVATLAAVSAALLLVLAGCSDTSSDRQSVSGAASPQPSATGTAPPQVQAWTGILIERGSGHVLWSKDPDRELAPASCTKIMTALLTLEHVKDLDAYATVPRIPLPQKVGVGLVPGDRITVREALTALLVKSANDAALTLASYVGRQREEVHRADEPARAAAGTHAHPLQEQPRDAGGRPLLVGARPGDAGPVRHARRHLPRARRARRTAVIHYPPDAAVPVENHNRLLGYPWGDGIKTGATAESGKVLVGSGKPGPVALIVVTMHEPTRDQEVKDAVALFAWGTAEYLRRSAPSPAASPSP